MIDIEQFRDEHGKIDWVSYAITVKADCDYKRWFEEKEKEKKEPIFSEGFVVLGVILGLIVCFFAIAFPGHWIWYIGR